MKKNYLELVEHYTNCLKEHGETHRGVDWPKIEDLKKRYEVIFDITKYGKNNSQKIDLIDFGCGFGLFLDFLAEQNLKETVNYLGIDLSHEMIEAARRRYQNEKFIIRDIIENPLEKNSCDYLIMNGVLTEKRSLSYDEMKIYAQNLIKVAFDTCRIGMSFNVMSAHVDWQRDDLFHFKFDELAEFLTKECSRNFVIRSDYGLYEYMVYLFKSPN